MVEIIWRFSLPVFDDEHEFGEVLEQILTLPGMSGRRYDLNRRGQWRTFELGNALVDALTQRTQLLSVEGDQGAQFMVAMGKHGEQPTAIIQLPEVPGIVQTLLESLGARYRTLPLHSTLISSGAWRDALTLAGLPTSTARGSFARAMSWRADVAPAWLERLDARIFDATPARLERHKTHTVLRLAANASESTDLIAGPAHIELLESILAMQAQ